ncbi:MAG: HAD-IC family P-type ATPase, partial [Burkholderiaceae bacterium]
MPSETTPWHALDAATVVRQLASDAASGLSAQAVALRSANHGPNALREARKRSAVRVFLRQFKSPLIYILFIAAVLSAAMGHAGDSGVILGVVIVNALVGAYQEGRAERSMAALRRLSALQVRVVRAGQEQPIPARELVPGDILLLSAGDAVGADARLLAAAALGAAEAALTGESLPVAKGLAALPEATGLADRRNMVFSGTYITAGRGRAVVTATGTHTEVGRIARLTETAEEPKTPLELRIAHFGRYLVGGSLLLFGAVMLLGVLRGLALAEVTMVAISQMVSMVPEGLPVAMTIALAVGMQRMAGRGAIIRRLSAVETLGSITVICSDKTGTLTRNQMTVSALWLPDGRCVDIDGVGYAPHGTLSAAGVAIGSQDSAVAALLQAAVLCNDAELVAPLADEAAPWGVLGDPTEAALLVAATKAGIDVQALRRRMPRQSEIPFDPDLKMMATRHCDAGAPGKVLIKGAPEAVLRLCAADGPVVVEAGRAAAEAMAGRALRVLAVAHVADDALRVADRFSAFSGRATLLGLIGQIDPPREEAKAAVAHCRAAGIRPLMVTGDHKLTGLAIARELGITRESESARDADRAVDGAELERMSDAELRDQLPHIAVFARVQPAQKLRIVQALQARGDVVAMTGDGVNDAPALARADVGVAMGISGTEVA